MLCLRDYWKKRTDVDVDTDRRSVNTPGPPAQFVRRCMTSLLLGYSRRSKFAAASAVFAYVGPPGSPSPVKDHVPTTGVFAKPLPVNNRPRNLTRAWASRSQWRSATIASYVGIRSTAVAFIPGAGYAGFRLSPWGLGPHERHPRRTKWRQGSGFRSPQAPGQTAVRPPSAADTAR